MKTLVGEFKQYLENKNQKEKSIDRQILYLERYIRKQKIKSIDDITFKSIEDYKNYLSHTKPPKKSIYY